MPKPLGSCELLGLELPGTCELFGTLKPAGGWLPLGGFKLEGICGGLPKPDGACGGLLWKLLGTGGGLNPFGVELLGAAVLAGGVCDSLDGAVVGAGLAACCDGSVVDVGAGSLEPATGAPGWLVTAGDVVPPGATGAGALVDAGVVVDAGAWFDGVVAVLDPTGGD